jgi:hypothetical protein
MHSKASGKDGGSMGQFNFLSKTLMLTLMALSKRSTYE